MKILRLVSVSILCSLFFATSVKSAVFQVSSQQEFDDAHDSSSSNDTIVWKSGTFSDIYMDIDKDRL